MGSIRRARDALELSLVRLELAEHYYLRWHQREFFLAQVRKDREALNELDAWIEGEPE